MLLWKGTFVPVSPLLKGHEGSVPFSASVVQMTSVSMTWPVDTFRLLSHIFKIFLQTIRKQRFSFVTDGGQPDILSLHESGHRGARRLRHHRRLGRRLWSQQRPATEPGLTRQSLAVRQHRKNSWVDHWCGQLPRVQFRHSVVDSERHLNHPCQKFWKRIVEEK